MVASFAIIRRPAYYTSQPSDYYRSGAESGGVWLRGNAKLRIVAGTAVNPNEFDLLCDGCDAAGNRLVSAPLFKRRAPGVDITLSSPKSVSVLYAAGDPELRASIADAERAAVEAVLGLIEKEILLVRRGRNGIRREHAKEFVAAVFTHSEARPETHADGTVLASVQRHHHVCLPSICERFDGTFGAIDTAGDIRSWKKAFGSAFRLQLSVELQGRGFAIDRSEDDWRWSVAGVPAQLCEYFSARRSAIERELAKAGLTSTAAPAAAAAVARKSRRAKEEINDAGRSAQWHEAMHRLGFEPESVIAAAREAGRRLALARQSEDSGTRIQQAAAGVPSELTEHEATFSRRHVVETACNALVGTGASVEDALKHVDDLMGRAIVALGESRDGPVLSTPEMVAIERRLVETAVELAQARIAAPDPTHVRHLCRRNGLSEEQTNVALAATSGRRLVSILAPAGTGKSTALNAIARAFESMGNRAGAGYAVCGASVSWRASLDVGASVGVPSLAIDALLARIDRRAAAGRPAFDRKTILLVDESGLQSSVQLARLVDLVDGDASRDRLKNNLCGLIMVGDDRQLRPVGPGHSIRLVRDAIGAVSLSQIHRQREPWAREAVLAFACGDAQSGLAAFHERGLVAFHDQLKSAVDALVDDWSVARLTSSAERLIVLAKTNAEARALGAALRSRLRSEGRIGQREIVLPAADASGNAHALPVAIGDQLVALRRVDRLGVVNGTALEVEGIKTSRLTKTVQITARCGDRRITFSPTEFADAKGRVRLANGLVSTAFRAQGLTVDRAFVWLTDRLDRHDAYVMASRSTAETRWYGARNSLDSGLRGSCDDPDQAIDDARRLDYLAERLSRERIKSTTLDLVDIAAIAQRHAARTRSRVSELSHEL
ncbi:relaxase domain-containing protein [Bradyrhizobium diazoefficiens]|uniref:MobF family relaxase n=1 Tax=Bradyrhizobium diazoefficiens TaxID=1355477 RepID=UPI001B8CD8E1|nr:MobF family relaxase [Bradyrhizobium diazoefficiens]MBR0866797.1 relaxase domain-containing protein [Bradyrhizobium diazoefficiens]MBR0891236.1 relaxase domain-containing protein [Bradyrhizobium diazoefficiens]MBR0923235.1 relaxase domain-containing protein [Bradyrhizobium diazoefficiens]